eukprot:4966085-Prymnesium_polylepis.1
MAQIGAAQPVPGVRGGPRPPAPPRGTCTTLGGVTCADRALPTPVAYAGVVRRAKLPLVRRRVACRSLDVEPNGPKKQILPQNAASPTCEPRCDRRRPNDALTPVGRPSRLPSQAATRTPRPAQSPVRSATMIT